MPCHEVRTVSVEFKIGNIEFLKEAIKKIPFWQLRDYSDTMIIIRDNNFNRITIDLKNSIISTVEKDSSIKINQLKRAYSEIVINEIAKKQKWILKKTTERKFQLIKY